MTQTEKKEFQKAYVELYEIIKVLPNEEQKKIPKLFLKNLKNNMDKEYKFILNKDGDMALTLGTDYTADAQSRGTTVDQDGKLVYLYDITVTGKGNYNGTQTFTDYKIKAGAEK